MWTDCRWYSVGDLQISFSVIYRKPVWRIGDVDTNGAKGLADCAGGFPGKLAAARREGPQ